MRNFARIEWYNGNINLYKYFISSNGEKPFKCELGSWTTNFRIIGQQEVTLTKLDNLKFAGQYTYFVLNEIQ